MFPAFTCLLVKTFLITQLCALTYGANNSLASHCEGSAFRSSVHGPSTLSLVNLKPIQLRIRKPPISNPPLQKVQPSPLLLHVAVAWPNVVPRKSHLSQYRIGSCVTMSVSMLHPKTLPPIKNPAAGLWSTAIQATPS
jgi:hypothetical protein